MISFKYRGGRKSDLSKIRSLGVSFGFSNLIAKLNKSIWMLTKPKMLTRTKNIFIFNFSGVLFC